MAPISDQHWHEIVDVHPNLGVLEAAVLTGAGAIAAGSFREYAIERLQCGDERLAGPKAMGRVLADLDDAGRTDT